MQLIKQPNKWSCSACAFAMALNLTLKEFIYQIGHDGSEIWFPELPEPLCRKGFPYPECIQVCLKWDFSVTPVDFKPLCGPDNEHRIELDHTDFANQMLRGYRGIISGMGNQYFHTVAWDGKQIYDPSLGVYGLKNSYFRPEVFWVVK